jgi:hypothetical protein
MNILDKKTQIIRVKNDCEIKIMKNEYIRVHSGEGYLMAMIKAKCF